MLTHKADGLTRRLKSWWIWVVDPVGQCNRTIQLGYLAWQSTFQIQSENPIELATDSIASQCLIIFLSAKLTSAKSKFDKSMFRLLSWNWKKTELNSQRTFRVRKKICSCPNFRQFLTPSQIFNWHHLFLAVWCWHVVVVSFVEHRLKSYPPTWTLWWRHQLVYEQEGAMRCPEARS